MSNLERTPLRTWTEPTNTRIADLSALVAGVALAVSLEWYSGWGSRTGLGGAAAPRWYTLLSYVNEGVGKGLVAMIPVVVSRRVRYGGTLRPAEFLALSSGLTRLLLSLARLPALGLVVRRPGVPVLYMAVMERYRLWMLTELVIAATAVALAARFRRRMPPWVTCLLLLGVWVALAPMEVFVHDGRDAVMGRVQLPFWGARLFDEFLTMPFRVFGMVPLVLAVRDALRRDRAGRTWVEQACLGLALTAFVGGRLRLYSQYVLARGGSGSLDPVVLDLVELVLAIGLCLAIASRYGPGLGRWFGLDEPPGKEESIVSVKSAAQTEPCRGVVRTADPTTREVPGRG